MLNVCVNCGIYRADKIIDPSGPYAICPACDHKLVQKDPGKYWITVMTSMFLHTDIIHLLGNMYFLWIFGDNLEDRMGRFNYLCFYISGGFIAGIAHTLATSQPQIPTLGASGAISAVMGGYLVLFDSG